MAGYDRVHRRRTHERRSGPWPTIVTGLRLGLGIAVIGTRRPRHLAALAAAERRLPPARSAN